MSGQMDAQTPFTLITANVNNLSENPEKQAGIKNVFANGRPHVLILTETGEDSKGLPHIHDSQLYIRYSARAGSNPSTGVAVYVDRRLRSNLVPLPTAADLKGRLCAVDVVMPDETKRRKTIRIIGVYASPKVDDSLSSSTLTPFWSAVCSLTSSVPDWIVGGDFNAHLLPDESFSLSKGHDLHRDKQVTAYRAFLNASHGVDTWEAQGGVTWQRDWTMKGHSIPSTRRVIDRFAVSPSVVCVKTETLSGDGVNAALTPSTPPSLLRFAPASKTSRPCPFQRRTTDPCAYSSGWAASSRRRAGVG